MSSFSSAPRAGPSRVAPGSAHSTPTRADLSYQQQHYSTFTNDLQRGRLAALQPEAIEEKGALAAASEAVSNACANFFQTLLYRVASACLPCWELISAFNLFPRLREGEEQSRRDRSGKVTVS